MISRPSTEAAGINFCPPGMLPIFNDKMSFGGFFYYSRADYCFNYGHMTFTNRSNAKIRLIVHIVFFKVKVPLKMGWKVIDFGGSNNTLYKVLPCVFLGRCCWIEFWNWPATLVGPLLGRFTLLFSLIITIKVNFTRNPQGKGQSSINSSIFEWSTSHYAKSNVAQWGVKAQTKSFL